MTPTPVGFLLVIPCYRESERLPKFLNDLCETLTPEDRTEILIVDDGSGEAEQNRMQMLVGSIRERHAFVREPLLLPENRGKGGTVYEGWDQRQNEEWLAFVDADGSCPAHEVCRLIRTASHSPKDVSAIFASRVKMLGHHVDRLLKRHLMGRAFATLVSELLRIDVYDSQCGLKLVRHRAYEDVKASLQLHGFAFDVELLAALLDTGHVVKEKPIDWHEVAGGKINLLRDSWRMFRDVWHIHHVRRNKGYGSLRSHLSKQ